MIAGWIPPCPECGLRSCERDCAWRDWLDEPAELSCSGCDQPWDANGYCPRCEQTREEAEAFEAERLTRQVERELRFQREVDAVRAAKNRRAA